MTVVTRQASLSTAQDAVAVTPGDPIAPCRALYVGTAGTLSFTTINGTVHVEYPVQAGLFPVAVASVESGGDADDILALY